MHGRTVDPRVKAEQMQAEWHDRNTVRLQKAAAQDMVDRIAAKIKKHNGKAFDSAAQQLYVYQQEVELAIQEWRHYQMPFCQAFGNEEWFTASISIDTQTQRATLAFPPTMSALMQGRLNIQILAADAPIIKYALGEPLDESHPSALLPK